MPLNKEALRTRVTGDREDGIERYDTLTAALQCGHHGTASRAWIRPGRRMFCAEGCGMQEVREYRDRNGKAVNLDADWRR